jgi:hypothetical protein
MVEPKDTDSDLLRNRLLMQAERGEITKKQAEAAAAAHGLEPFERIPELPRFDPNLKSHWSIVMAVAWIARRDFGLVREQDPEFCSEHIRWVYRERKGRSRKDTNAVLRKGYFLETRRAPTVRRLAILDELSRARDNVPSTAVMKIREAVAALWQALLEKRLIALGFDAHGAVVEIPSQEWAYLRLREERGRDVLRYDAVNRPEPYTAVILRQSDLLRQWPAIGVASKAQSGRWQVDNINSALSIEFPDGVPPHLTHKEVQKRIQTIFENNSWKLPSLDSIARARGRRRRKVG